MTPGPERQSPSQLQRAVEVMDRLRSPGGCPWDIEQTHASLTRYLLEETYEVLEAIETGDLTLLREELGDLLLQVLFHARIASELPADSGRFDIEDVAGDLTEKLIARHPHVFADVQVASVAEQTELWERLKVAEKGRTSAVDGVPLAQPALALTAKLIARADRAGLGDLQPPAEDELGARLFALVREAVAAGVDPEAALRRTARAFRAAVVQAESDRAGSERVDRSGMIGRMTFADIDRPEPATTADERTTLTEFLDYYRATLAVKCAGLTPEQLAQRAVEPSKLSLLGLVRHMGEVEQGWFRSFAGEQIDRPYSSSTNPDGDFDDAVAEQECVDEALAFWQAEIAHAREITAVHDLERTYLHPRHGEEFSLRWVLVHMIEEYARHCGHADFLRERIDGATGD